jgi:hypothetical protein
MSAHHAMKGRSSYPGSDLGVGSAHAAFDAPAHVNGRHREIYDSRELGCRWMSQTRSIPNAPESENSVREFVVLEPVHEKLRHAAQPHSHSSVLPAIFGAKPAREILEHNACLASPKFDSAPHYYGKLFQLGTRFATGARAWL